MIKSDIPPRGASVRSEGGYRSLTAESEEDFPMIVKQIVESGCKIYHISAKLPSLEEIFFSLIEKQGVDHA